MSNLKVSFRVYNITIEKYTDKYVSISLLLFCVTSPNLGYLFQNIIPPIVDPLS